jgi:hypothetical protein
MTSLLNRLLKRVVEHEISNNEMYGHAAVLRSYCGLKIPLPIQGYLQHGWSYGPGMPLGDVESGDVPRESHFFLWNPRNEKICHDLGLHNVRVIGAPLV